MVAAKQLERRIREDTAVPAAARYIMCAAARLAEASRHRRKLAGVPFYDHQRIRIGNGKRAQQNRLHEAVDCRIGADAESEPDHRKRGVNPLLAAMVRTAYPTSCPNCSMVVQLQTLRTSS
jgi:hypothetical protein